MDDGECNYVGTDAYGNSLYAAPQPMLEKIFEMSLYTDFQCLVLYDGDGNEDMNYDYVKNGYSKSAYYNSNYYQSTSQATQEYTMTLFNEVFEQFRYCTLCIDYPSYQDGYFNGDYGTDDDDLINQCWKFYSHTTYHCTIDCIATAATQGTIGIFKYGNTYYGQDWEGTSRSGKYKRYDSFKHQYVTSGTSDWSNSGANVFFVFNAFLLFCTYQAYLNKDEIQRILDGSNAKEQRRKLKRTSSSSRKQNPKKEALLTEKDKQWVDISSLASFGSNVGNSQWVDTMKHTFGVENGTRSSSRRKTQRRKSRHASSKYTTTTKISRNSSKPRTPPLKIMTTDAHISSTRTEQTRTKSEHKVLPEIKPKVYVKPRKPKTSKKKLGSNQGERVTSNNVKRLKNIKGEEAQYQPPVLLSRSRLPIGSKTKITTERNDEKSRVQFDLTSLESYSDSESLYSFTTDEGSANYSVEMDERSTNTTEGLNHSRSIEMKRTKKDKAANAAKSVLEKYKSSYHARTKGRVPPNSSAKSTNASIENNDSMDSDDFSILWKQDKA
jgi:hypothetical protein